MDYDSSRNNSIVQEESKFDVEVFDLPLVLNDFLKGDVKCDLQFCMLASNHLCFLQSQKWAADLLKSVALSKIGLSVHPDSSHVACFAAHPDYFLIKDAMLRYQYGEAMVYAKKLQDRFKEYPALRFLYFYNKYLHGQSHRIQNADSPLEFSPNTEADLKYLMILREELKHEDLRLDLDPFLNYLYGTVLRQLGIYELARKRLLMAIEKEPRMWCFWFELADCVLSKSDLDSVMTSLPRHWMRDLFLARTYLLLNMGEEAYGTLKYLRKGVFAGTSYIMVEIARVHLMRRELQDCVKQMEKVRAAEPGRMDDMDFYSNVLYVKGDKTRLAKLIREMHDSDPFAPETNIAVANYYSMRDQHDRAIEHIVLALRSFPEIPAGYLTLGHEYFELKNNSRAVLCYQKAIELNPREYRAYFGLGQVHENEEKYAMAIYYYQKSVANSCTDHRPWIALGNTFKKNNQTEEASRIYWQAYINGEKDDGAIVKLAKIYEEAKDTAKMVTAFERAVELYEEVGAKIREENSRGFAADLGHGHMVLAEHYYLEGRVEEAKDMARKAESFSAVMKEAGDFLKRFDEDSEMSLMDRTVASVDDMEMSLINVTHNSSDALISDDEENLPA